MYVGISFLIRWILKNLRLTLNSFYWKKLSSARLIWIGGVGCYRGLTILRFKQGLNIVNCSWYETQRKVLKVMLVRCLLPERVNGRTRARIACDYNFDVRFVISKVSGLFWGEEEKGRKEGRRGCIFFWHRMRQPAANIVLHKSVGAEMFGQI